jgi:hypothetical protein|tara:strand:- start:2734 stop:3258 length:525 start_codon:yes stop_codon:yes gene_type:complete
MYFMHFPKVAYDVKGDGVTTQMTDITRRARISHNSIIYKASYDYYDVLDTQKPEDIAYDYYGDAGLHWIILMVNNINDIYTDWPMSVTRLERYTKSKYDNIDAVHHYEIYQESGDTTVTIELPNDAAQTIPVDATAITNAEYEEAEVEKKRRIRLIRPEYVDTIREEFRKSIKA